MRLSAVVVTDNDADTIKQCLSALLDSIIPLYRIIVIDNNSEDNTTELVSPQCRLIKLAKRVDVATCYNIGLHQLPESDVILLLRGTVELRPTATQLITIAASEYPEVGIWGSTLVYSDVEQAGYSVGNLSVNAVPKWLRYGIGGRVMQFCDFASSKMLAVTRQAIDACNTVPTGYYTDQFSIIDYCWQVRQYGLNVAYLPGVVAVLLGDRQQHQPPCRYWHQDRLAFMIRNYPLRNLFQAILPEWDWYRQNKQYAGIYYNLLTELPGLIRDRIWS